MVGFLQVSLPTQQTRKNEGPLKPDLRNTKGTLQTNDLRFGSKKRSSAPAHPPMASAASRLGDARGSVAGGAAAAGGLPSGGFGLWVSGRKDFRKTVASVGDGFR